MGNGLRVCVMIVIGVAVSLPIGVRPVGAADIERVRPSVCRSRELLRALRIIDGACTAIACDLSTLRQLNTLPRQRLLSALWDPALMPVNIFFPSGQTDVRRAFDWRSRKRLQLSRLKDIFDPENAIVYVVGRASDGGSIELNSSLGRERMESVMRYLKDDLHVRCHRFSGVWLPEGVVALGESDARLLNIDSREYRHDPSVLNQSILVFVYPCPASL